MSGSCRLGESHSSVAYTARLVITLTQPHNPTPTNPNPNRVGLGPSNFVDGREHIVQKLEQYRAIQNEPRFAGASFPVVKFLNGMRMVCLPEEFSAEVGCCPLEWLGAVLCCAALHCAVLVSAP